MRELSPDVVKQLLEQLDKARPAGAAGVREAMIEITFLVAAVDGKVTALEVAQFAEAVETIFGAGADGDTDVLVGRMAERLAKEGWGPRMAAVEKALAGSEHRETAYRLAAGVAFVDDTIAEAEAEALDRLARGLGISGERADVIMTEVHDELFG